MALDFRKVCEIVLALLRAMNKKDGGDVRENVPQTSAASGDDAAGQSPGTLSRLTVNSACSTGHKPTSGYPVSEAFELNKYPATNAGRLRAVELTTRLGFDGTGTNQRPDDTLKGLNHPRVHIDALRSRSWGHGGTAIATPFRHCAANLRLVDGEPSSWEDLAKALLRAASDAGVVT